MVCPKRIFPSSITPANLDDFSIERDMWPKDDIYEPRKVQVHIIFHFYSTPIGQETVTEPGQAP